MATQRYVSTSFWNDPWVLEECTSDERYVYLYLLTCPSSNIAGIYELSLRNAELHTGYDREQLQRIFNRFEESGKAYYRHRYVIIPKWPTHQRWQQRSKIKSGIENVLNELPREVLKTAKELGYEFPISDQYGIDRVSIGYAYESNYSDSDSDSDSDTDSDIDTKIAAHAANNDGQINVYIKGELQETIDLTDSPLAEVKLYPVNKPSQMSDETADVLETIFWALNGQPAAIGKERNHCKKLATVCKARAPDEEGKYASDIVGMFYQLRKTSRKNYWRCPFDAANLVQKFNAVADELERRQEEQVKADIIGEVF